MKVSLAIGVLGLIPLEVSADHFGTADATLLTSGDWTVAVQWDSTLEEAGCFAWTENAEGQTFGFGTLVSQGRLVGVYDERWSLPVRDMEFRVDIDGSRWIMSGWSEGSMLRDDDNNSANHHGFARDIASGRTLTVIGEAGERLALFSLEGAAPAMDTYAWCESHIGWGRS